jgi:hypothetical protein
MKERPIIFSGPMVKAILDGSKKQTRRLLKPQPAPVVPAWSGLPLDHFSLIGVRIENETLMWQAEDRRNRAMLVFPVSTYGVREQVSTHAPGNQLWVRETWRLADVSPPGRLEVIYRADGGDGPWRSPIHMPRWASRITLRVTRVRVQRLQEITSADAIAEGCAPHANSQTVDCATPDPRDDFAALWDAIHGKGAWSANPWIVALTFERVQP